MIQKFTDKINESVENRIPSAEEWLSNHKELSSYDVAYHDEGGYQGVDESKLYKIMIEFAKLHVEAALKAALNNVEIENCGNPYDPSDDSKCVSETSILNAYPLTNIR
jgi:hypothetical protein